MRAITSKILLFHLLSHIHNTKIETVAAKQYQIHILIYYTNIPHSQFLRILNEPIHFYFKDGDGESIEVDTYGGQWRNIYINLFHYTPEITCARL